MIYQCSEIPSIDGKPVAPPVGYVYMQFKDCPEPSSLWVGTTWQNVVANPTKTFGAICVCSTSTAGLCVGCSCSDTSCNSTNAGCHNHCSGWSCTGNHCHKVSLSGCSCTAPVSTVVRLWKRTA